MARKKGRSPSEQTVLEYHHDNAKGRNLPPAGLAAQGILKAVAPEDLQRILFADHDLIDVICMCIPKGSYPVKLKLI